MADQDYITAAEAAGMLEMHPESFRRLLRQKKKMREANPSMAVFLETFQKPAFRTGRKFFFRRIDVERLATKRRTLQS